ncbi:MAG TPA: phosphoenolpyruvate synthase [Marmoricola sp.]|nr:phosphoenolpyruvate synthase [Marmoricola sp.]
MDAQQTHPERPVRPGAAAPYVRRFAEIGSADVGLVGGKNASLGEMYQRLSAQGVHVPNGFAITAHAYREVLRQGDVQERLERELRSIDVADAASLDRGAAQARRVVYGAGLPAPVAAAIAEGYARLEEEYGADVSVAVRSSATAEDLPEASFAGQHESYLAVSGLEAVMDAVRHCFASLFTARGIDYRRRQGFDDLQVALSVGVMKMVRADQACSGVAFTLDTESGFRDVVLITGSYGLGETVVQGMVDPDEFYVHKPTFDEGSRAVLRRRRGGKAVQMVLAADGRGTHVVPTPVERRDRFCLADAEVLELTAMALTIERHYGLPMDIEWAKDGPEGGLAIVQARPETAASRRAHGVVTTHVVTSHGELLATGRAVGDGVASGAARVVTHAAQLGDFRDGEVLVARSTTPDWEPAMKRAAAIVTDHGGRTCHAAIIARELGLPAAVGTGEATAVISSGETVTVSCAEGDTAHVYRGAASVRTTESRPQAVRPRTQVMVNLGNPDLAFETSYLPNDGVGLARMEFILAAEVKVHPLAALHPDRVVDAGQRAAIAELTRGYPDGAAYFVQRLSEGIGTIAAAFYPKPVVVRLSDFKSNEYASLLGGADFEPAEANPMLGFRGASRYAHPAYADGFALECRALRRVREEMGLRNVIVMIPFVRRLAEADLVLARMAELGLTRGREGLQIYAMCEIPNNVVLVDEFAARFDGFSIGSNDLTQLTLGVDRDSELVAFDYDERDPGVLRMIEQAVAGCHRHGIHCGICGQAPSDYPDFLSFLVGTGIDAISLNPDSVAAASAALARAEAEQDARG